MVTFMDSNETTIKFHKACIDKDLKTMKNLLKNKEKIDVIQLDQMGTLCWIVKVTRFFSETHMEVVKLLCELGVDLEQKDSYTKTPLHEACGSTLNFDCFEIRANPSLVKLLLEHGASVHAKDFYGHTPLYKACLRGNLEVVQMLIQYHADVNARDELKRTPLHFACIYGHLEIVQELLKHRPDINAIYATEEGIKMTPLMCAAELGHSDVVEELLNHGADVDFKDANSGNALH